MRAIKLLTFPALVILTVNYSPMIYTNVFGSGGDFVQSYKASMPPKEFMNIISANKTRTIVIGETKNNYTHIVFTDSKIHYHTWLYNDTAETPTKSTLIFSGISNSIDEASIKRINKDFGLTGNLYYSKRFSQLLSDLGIQLTKN